MSDPRLRPGWRWMSIEQIADPSANSITDGPFGTNLKTEHYTDFGPRVVRLQNIGDCQFKDEKAHISDERFALLKRHRVYPGDLLVAALGEQLPRACLVPEGLGPAIVKADCIRFKPNPAVVTPQFAMYALNSPQLREQAARIVHGVGRPRLNQGEIKSLRLPIAPFEQQLEIVAEIEKQFSRLGAGVAALSRLQVHLQRYQAAVLKVACEGRLVQTEEARARAEDRSYEPAPILLGHARPPVSRNVRRKTPAAPEPITALRTLWYFLNRKAWFCISNASKSNA